jgi:MerR family transcriptional regulator, light-induced transcriptional regulator
MSSPLHHYRSENMSLLHAPVANFLHSALQSGSDDVDAASLLSTLVYQSRPVKLFTETELQDLLDHARARNHANAITGLLVYDHGCFFQWLEGPTAAVAEVWASIQRDPRHGNVEVLGEKSITKRLFSEWDMRLAWRKDAAHIAIPASVEVPDSILERLRTNPDQNNPAWGELATLGETGRDGASPADAIEPTESEPSYERIGEVVASELIPRLLMVHRVAAADENVAASVGAGAKKRIEITETTDVIDEFTQCALSEDPAAAGAYAALLHEKGLAIESIFLHVLQPVARRLGDLCNQDICHDVEVTVGMWRLQSLVRDLSAGFQAEAPPVASNHSVLVATQPGEPHMLGMRLDAEFFWRAGWDVMCEFPATDEELENLVTEQWFDVLDLSLSSAFQRDHRLAAMTATIQAVRRASFNPNIRVMVCGRVFLEHPEFSLLIGADVGCSTAEKVVMRAESTLKTIDSPALVSARDALKKVAGHVAAMTFRAPD